MVKPVVARIGEKITTEVEVLVIGSHFCPVGAWAVLMIRKVARELGERVIVREVPANREAIAHNGVADGIFINGKVKFIRPA